ncbi:hypothetical protein FEM48_Zijuj12G0172500 [Ziziphus jujuba var. spinosa]|uniref:Glutamine amidotransferase domain-containing protein n=1 Tax=Ziziphus jujuba var. spinosa TaxID=714518 RepID=A0A978UEL9_ZIZJJ|nr:hypothetical protein FEM48_Zijuj12G0172500 [Ziziphus jujuba var. spinosa]
MVVFAFILAHVSYTIVVQSLRSFLIPFLLDDEESMQCFFAGLVIRSLSIRYATFFLRTYMCLMQLASYGCKITIVPSTWPALEVLKMKPDGVLFSNGPRDPSAFPCVVGTIKEILGKFGHHGGNHPVRNLRIGDLEISAQDTIVTTFRKFIEMMMKDR